MNKNVIPNLAKACEVLRFLVAHDGLPQSKVEALVGIPRATAFRMLNTFCIEGFANKRGTRYYAGPALAQFGLKSLSTLEIRNQAKPVLDQLAQETGETAHLAVESGHHSLILEVCDSPNPIRVASRPGSLADIHCSSTGKVLLAYKNEERRESLMERIELKPRTDRTLTDLDSLRTELKRVRECGYAIDDEEYFIGVRCLAAPVFDGAGTVVAAIGITGTALRFTRERNDEVADLVVASSKALESRLQEQR